MIVCLIFLGSIVNHLLAQVMLGTLLSGLLPIGFTSRIFAYNTQYPLLFDRCNFRWFVGQQAESDQQQWSVEGWEPSSLSVLLERFGAKSLA